MRVSERWKLNVLEVKRWRSTTEGTRMDGIRNENVRIIMNVSRNLLLSIDRSSELIRKQVEIG